MAFCEKCGKEISKGSVCTECASKANSNTEKSFFQTILDTKDTTADFSKEEIEKNKVVCGLAYIPILFWLPLVAGTKGSKYCKFHSNNGLLLLILDVVLGIVSSLLGLIPFVGGALAAVVGTLVGFYSFVGIVLTLLDYFKILK